MLNCLVANDYKGSKTQMVGVESAKLNDLCSKEYHVGFSRICIAGLILSVGTETLYHCIKSALISKFVYEMILDGRVR